MIESISAIVFAVFTGVVMVFQGCLATVSHGEQLLWVDNILEISYQNEGCSNVNIIILDCMAALVLTNADLLFRQLKPISTFGI